LYTSICQMVALAAGLPFLTADYWRLPAAPGRLP
jgi:hypothetical protein